MEGLQNGSLEELGGFAYHLVEILGRQKLLIVLLAKYDRLFAQKHVNACDVIRIGWQAQLRKNILSLNILLYPLDEAKGSLGRLVDSIVIAFEFVKSCV